MAIANTVPSARSATSVLDLLTAQHREVNDLFNRIERRDGDRTELFIELADKLAAHSTIEEMIFYPGVIDAYTTVMLHASVEEHLEIKRTLADLITMKLSDEGFRAKLAVLRENVSHHAHHEEEAKLFPLLRRTLSAERLAALGSQCSAMYELLMLKHPFRNVPRECRKAASLPPIT